MRPANRWVVIGVVIAAFLAIVLIKTQEKPDQAQVALTADTTVAGATCAGKIDSVCCAAGDCSGCGSTCCPPGDTLGCATEAEMAADNASVSTPVKPAVLPRFLELGSVGCGPCDAMAPILEELRKEYPSQVSIEFFDVKKDIAPARQYSIRVIPTQIFLDSEGKEIFRHEGFFPKEEILPILAKLGVNI